MDHLVGEYLVNGRAVNGRAVNGRAPQTPTPQSLLIVETRRSFWLPLVIKNAHKEFSNWVLWVLGPKEVIDFVSRECPGIEFRAIVSDLPRKCTPATFSAVMFAPQLWDLFDTEFVMIFQLDTVFAPGAAGKLPNPANEDYYGAVCGSFDEDAFVINGGLSYRRVSAFRQACKLLTEEDRALPEDVAFCRVMRRHPQCFRLPSLRQCMAFAIESFGDPFSVVGIHGTDKGYCPPGLLASVVGSGAFVDVFPYDGEPILETRLKLLWNLVDVFVVVEARQTHSGLPKEPAFDPKKYAPYASKIRHVVIDEFPPAPPGFGRGKPWIRPESADAWWREMYQRDYFLSLDLPADATYIVSDVDEIPDPYVLATLRVDGIAHLDMAFLVHRPCWQKGEPWCRAFVSSGKPARSPTDIRCSRPVRVVENAGWHCSSFFDVDSQVRKLRHYAHREHAGQADDPEAIRRRLETGKDPYGRSAEYDCVRTDQHQFLEFV